MNQCLSFSSSPSGLCQMMSINSIYTIPLHPPDPASTWHHHVVGASPQERNRKCCTMVILTASNFLTRLNPFNTYCFSWNKTPFWNGETVKRFETKSGLKLPVRLCFEGTQQTSRGLRSVDSFGSYAMGIGMSSFSSWFGLLEKSIPNWRDSMEIAELSTHPNDGRLSMLHCPFFLLRFYHPEIPSLHPLSASSHWWPEKKSTVTPPSLKLFMKISHFNLTFPPKNNQLAPLKKKKRVDSEFCQFLLPTYMSASENSGFCPQIIHL